MQFTQNALVYTSDRKPVGRITHAVLDRVTKKVTHIVVRHGLILREDKVIPIHMFESTCSEGAILHEGIEDWHHLPTFEEACYSVFYLPKDIGKVNRAGMFGALTCFTEMLIHHEIRLCRISTRQPRSTTSFGLSDKTFQWVRWLWKRAVGS